MMNAALKLDPENQKIQLKISHLEEMLNNRMQGNQLSPMNDDERSSNDKVYEHETSSQNNEIPALTESQ